MPVTIEFHPSGRKLLRADQGILVQLQQPTELAIDSPQLVLQPPLLGQERLQLFACLSRDIFQAAAEPEGIEGDVPKLSHDPTATIATLG